MMTKCGTLSQQSTYYYFLNDVFVTFYKRTLQRYRPQFSAVIRAENFKAGSIINVSLFLVGWPQYKNRVFDAIDEMIEVGMLTQEHKLTDYSYCAIR